MTVETEALLLDEIDERLEQLEKKVDRIVEFIDTVEKAFEQMTANPMFATFLGPMGKPK